MFLVAWCKILINYGRGFLKVQDWRWHHVSNGREYELGAAVLKSFAPAMIGCGRCEYHTARQHHSLSVLVVARVPETLHSVFEKVLSLPVDSSGIHLVVAIVHSILNVVHHVCGKTHGETRRPSAKTLE